MNQQHKVFISYHHANDQSYKEKLVKFGEENNIFINQSVDTGEIDPNLSDEKIREKIRDEYLKDSTVTILLVGQETKKRKHVDWELYSSMYNGTVNKQSGILCVNLTGNNWRSAYDESNKFYGGGSSASCDKNVIKQQHPLLPERIIDNLANREVKISVTNWSLLSQHAGLLKYLIDQTFEYRKNNDYDLSRPMMRR